jgi:hypothetical protein
MFFTLKNRIAERSSQSTEVVIDAVFYKALWHGSQFTQWLGEHWGCSRGSDNSSQPSGTSGHWPARTGAQMVSLFWGWSGTESTAGLLYQPRMIMDDDQCELSIECSEKTCCGATLCTTNPKRPDQGSNPGGRGGKPAGTNRLSCGMPKQMVLTLEMMLMYRYWFGELFLSCDLMTGVGNDILNKLTEVNSDYWNTHIRMGKISLSLSLSCIFAFVTGLFRSRLLFCM